METALQNLSKPELIPLLVDAREALAKQQRSNQNLELDVAYLKEQVALLSRMIYGQKRERFEQPGQPELPFSQTEEQELEDKEETVEKIKVSYERAKTKKDHPGRRPLPEHLRVEEEIIEPQEDTTGMVRIGEEVTDKLEFKPAEFYIHRTIRPKYATQDKEDQRVVIARLPERAFGKTIAGTGLLASIMVDKYVDHLPLYRQIQRFKREKIPISAKTLDGWVRQAGEFIQILYEHQKKKILSAGYLQADETTIKVLDRNKKGKTHLGYYWVCHSPVDGSVLFEYHPGRGGNAAMELLNGFKGYLQTDGYEVYAGLSRKKRDITHLCCWAHARREFERALDNDRGRASLALGLIQELYKVEREAGEQGMSSGQRKKLRLDKSLPAINALGKWLTDQYKSGEVLPQSRMGKAINYTLGRWDQLSVYLMDGALEIDNNLIENSIRPVAIGRKNYLFAGSHEGARRAAAYYSFFAMCKKADVNPREWLRFVLDNLLDTSIKKLDSLLPLNFKSQTEKV